MADATQRLSQLETGLAEVRAELTRTETDLRSARGRMEAAIDALVALEPKRLELEQERDRMRAELTAARAAAQAAQQRAREMALQVESRRSSHASLSLTLTRVEKQLEELTARRDELAAQLADGQAPLAGLEVQLEHALQVRSQIESELQAAKIASDELDALLRDREAQRAAIELKVETARGRDG